MPSYPRSSHRLSGGRDYRRVVGAQAKGSSGAPRNTIEPVVSGVGEVGETLTTTDGTWVGDATITFTYQWQRNGSNIGGETTDTYELAAEDEGTSVRCVVTGTNSVGSSAAVSNAISVAESGGNSYLVLEEDGSSKFTLEEGGGSLLMEES